MSVDAPARLDVPAADPVLPGAVDVACELPAQVTAVAATPEAVAAALDGFADLDAEERETLAGFRDPADADLYLVTHVALRRLVALRLRTVPAEVAFDRAPCAGCQLPHGRPVLAGAPAGGPFFSISHSRGLDDPGIALVAVASAPVGVDVEARADHVAGDGLDDLIACLHPSEQASLRRLPPSRRPTAFLDCWVRKEAYLKATGRGLALGVSAFRVGLGPAYGEPVVVDSGPPAWPIEALAVPDGVPAALCVRR
ncbi:MAG: 4'-phosphopantetheinyl transferase superfamily protein [Kineosporiaceae bacterium]